MPVDSLHPQVERMAPRWEKIEDCVAGGHVVKAKGKQYLPALKGHRGDDAAYAAYKERALYPNAPRRTLQGLTGLVFQEPPELVVSDEDAVSQILADVTLTGVPFVAFAKQVFRRVLAPGRCGVLVDMRPDDPRTAGRPRPYAAIYDAGAIVNWQTERLEDAQVLTRVVLFEEVEEPDPDDRFRVRLMPQYRVVELVEGVLVHQLWRKVREQSVEKWVPWGDPVVPMRRGEALAFVPFTFCNANSLTPDVEDPELDDLCEIALSMYRNSADLENGRHFAGNPQPYIFGVESGAALTMGSSRAWTSPSADAKAGMVEFTGQGLRPLETAIQEKLQLAVAHGARLLEMQKRAPETAEALRLRQSGESSVLSSIADTVGQGLGQVLAHLAWWQSAADLDDVEARTKVTLSQKFTREPMPMEDVKRLAESWAGGIMSLETALWNLRQGHRLPPDRTVEDERALLEMEEAQRGEMQ